MIRSRNFLLFGVSATVLTLIWNGFSSQNARSAEAVVWYLGHCGFAVKTSGHLLIFDYQERRDGQQTKVRPARPSLDNGWIDPEEINNLKVRVFIFYAHEDHFDPVIFGWKKTIPDIVCYFGWRASEDPAHHYLVGPRAELTAGGLEIATINSHHSGVPEVAWLVRVDGLVLYHNGDCQPGNPSLEYDFLREKADHIDIAFLPPVYEDGQKYTKQNLDLFDRFRVGAVFPMHARAGDSRYVDFQKAFQAKTAGAPIHIPMKMGERFIYPANETGK